MIIIGIDCGKRSGYAIIDAQGTEVKLLETGTLPVAGEGRKGLVGGAFSSLAALKGRLRPCQIVLSEIIQMPRFPTDHGAVEVQGVCRLYADAAYHPATIHSQLGTSNKPETRKFVERVLGYQLKVEQHCLDAAAVAICHALKMNAVQLTINLRKGEEKPKRTRGVRIPEPGEEVTPEKIVELMRAGKARVVR